MNLEFFNVDFLNPSIRQQETLPFYVQLCSSWYVLAKTQVLLLFGSRPFIFNQIGRMLGSKSVTTESMPKSLWKVFSERKVSYNFKRSYTTSYRIRRSNLFDKQLLGNKRQNKKRGYQRFPNVRNHPKIAKAQTVPTSSPYGELGISRPARHMASSACRDKLAIWRARPVPTSSPYGDYDHIISISCILLSSL